jgi:hypothetical protein
VIIEIFRLLLIAAMLTTIVTVAAGVMGSVAGVEITPRVGLIASSFCFVLWGLVAINAFEVSVFSGGQEFVREYRSVAYLAVGGASVALFSLIQATLAEIQETGGL